MSGEILFWSGPRHAGQSNWVAFSEAWAFEDNRFATMRPAIAREGRIFIRIGYSAERLKKRADCFKEKKI